MPHTGAVRLGENLGKVIEVLIHDGVVDPRHTIRLLNAFFGDYRLALLREGGTGRRALRAGEVTNFPLVLARLTVLKVDFPDAYAEIVLDTDLLEALDLLARGQKPTEHNEVLLKKLFAQPGDPGVPTPEAVAGDVDLPTDDKANLLRYLSRTRDYVEKVDSLLPFLYLGQDQIDRRLGSGEARRVKDMLANAQVDPLREHVKAIAGRTDAGSEHDIDALVELFGELLSSLTGLELANAQNTICQVFGELPAHLRGSLADRIGKFAEEQTMQLLLMTQSRSHWLRKTSALVTRCSAKSYWARRTPPRGKRICHSCVQERRRALSSAGYPRGSIDDS